MRGEYKELPVAVVTRKMDSDEPSNTKIVDHNNPMHRRWMGRHCFWAFRNGHSITSYQTDEPVNFWPKDPPKDRQDNSEDSPE